MIRYFIPLFLLVHCAFAADRTAAWKKVAEAEANGLPKTAMELLEPIVEGALADKAYAEAVKAITKKIRHHTEIQGGKAEEKIGNLQAEIEDVPDEVKPILETILAHWYWHFFQQNRWRFMQRTQTGEAAGNDIMSWDLARILAEIDKHFSTALAAGETLQKMPVADYTELLTAGNAPDSFRPTLYDFLAFEALSFYSAGEQAGHRAQDAFDLGADTPVFDKLDDFLAWQIETTDDTSTKVRALQLYQDVLRFHKNDANPDARIDADLGRLVYGYNQAYGADKKERYIAALERFVDEWADHRISARALHHWATILQNDSDFAGAHRLATRGARVHPETPGGNACHNLIQTIETKQVNLMVEQVWNEPWPKVSVSYKNIDKIWFRVVPYDWNKLLTSRSWSLDQLATRQQQKELIGMQPVKSWSVDLPPTDDYQLRQYQAEVPGNLAKGHYFVISSCTPTFQEKRNFVNYRSFWVSDLAVVTRTRQGSERVGGFVLDARSGEPIEGVQIQFWRRARRNWQRAGVDERTDKNGYFKAAISSQPHVIVARHQGDRVSTNNLSAHAYDMTARPQEHTTFFTDRSLYRPGQTIRFKGICIYSDHGKDAYRTINNRKLMVTFRDVNHKEIERREFRTNDYGSFSGSFTAPRDRLMGRMSIVVEGQPNGITNVTVEEYKRPKFEVTLDPPETAPKLDAGVTITGHAISYTGAAVNGAKVQYRVVREVRYPPWWGWYRWWMPQQSGGQEILHGVVRTETDGSFKITFNAMPDRTVPAADEPTFSFSVYADVTDTAGETRSGNRTVNVGYTTLQATLNTDQWQEKDKPVVLTIGTRTLDGVGQSAEGTVKIFRLQAPATVQRPQAQGWQQHRRMLPPAGQAGEPDLSDPNTWPLGDVAVERPFTTDAEGAASLSVALEPGLYRAKLESSDRFGKPVSALQPLQVLDPQASECNLKIPFLLTAPTWQVEPGDSLTALWGSGYDRARAYIEIEHRKKILRSFWTDPQLTQEIIELAVTEEMRGGFTVRVTMVRENRGYITVRPVTVPWSNKKLQVKWEHFTSKLGPAEKEAWTAIITGPDAEKVVAEMVAGLYDESLDAYLPHHWAQSIDVFRHDWSRLQSQFQNLLVSWHRLQGRWPSRRKNGNLSYRGFHPDVTRNFYHGYGGRRGKLRMRSLSSAPAPMASMEMAADADGMEMANGAAPALGKAAREDKAVAMDPAAAPAGGPGAEPKGPDLSKVTARKNLQETAFFFPHLISDGEGRVKLEFEMPEALTKWKFMALAHDAELRSGFLQDSVVTAKDLMVQPNPPRFLREGDRLEFTVKVINQSPTRQQGTVRLSLADARTAQSADQALGNERTDKVFDIPAKESRTYSWTLAVPDGQGFLSYTAVAATNKLSDGEEGYLPVLPRRIMVTESLPLPVRDAGKKTFKFEKLLASGDSDTIRHESLTVQMVSQPAWYAVMALPYLMEYPHGCAEQVFNRLYANALASHIANSDPKIRRIFDQWKGTEALDSPLEKNAELKAVMLEETPWVRQAGSESEARRNLGILFDKNRLNRECSGQQRRLEEMQRGDGSWGWFPGGSSNHYITLYITTGYGRLRHLGVKRIDVKPALNALNFLDGSINERYQDLKRDKRLDNNNLSPAIALYIYGRSFFLEDQVIAANAKEAVDYFLGQAHKHWLTVSRLSQGHLAVGLQRFGAGKETPAKIMRSIHEHSLNEEEMGMYWRDTEHSWWWYRAPIETQAMMIEAFDEVAKDDKAVEDCKVWLLKQKQTRDWKTTRATADAVYAMLLRGTDLLASDELVAVALADVTIEPKNVEAGTGFYEERFGGAEVKPAMGEVTLTKIDEGVSWGSIHWQYMEDMSKITPHTATPLTLEKALYIKENTRKGSVLNKVEGVIGVGDELVVRLVLRVDRDMEYVHLKDQRGAGTEPVNVLSKYRYQDGLAYYESTRDTASHFFIDYLPKGTYVFEYSTRVAHRGKYQSGIANIQCMYAPEFNSHSESFMLEVR